jgi:hypothetical protein
MLESEDTALRKSLLVTVLEKIDNTTAITSLSKEISRTKVLNASQAIQGKASTGVQVVSSITRSSQLPVIIRV